MVIGWDSSLSRLQPVPCPLSPRAREEAFERVLAGCEARHLRLVEESQRLRSLLVSLLRALVAASEQVSSPRPPRRVGSIVAWESGKIGGAVCCFSTC